MDSSPIDSAWESTSTRSVLCLDMLSSTRLNRAPSAGVSALDFDVVSRQFILDSRSSYSGERPKDSEVISAALLDQGDLTLHLGSWILVFVAVYYTSAISLLPRDLRIQVPKIPSLSSSPLTLVFAPTSPSPSFNTPSSLIVVGSFGIGIVGLITVKEMTSSSALDGSKSSRTKGGRRSGIISTVVKNCALAGL